MDVYRALKDISPTILADILGSCQVIAAAIRPLWFGMPRVVGPAYTVRCEPGDSLMLHAAIYRARPGSVMVVEGGDTACALAGGNVCAVAQKRGVLGFVLDGPIRDLADIRALQFPVFGRGVIPVAGRKDLIGSLNHPVRVGGVMIEPRDIVVADEEGIVVVPSAALDATVKAAAQKLAHQAAQSLEAWEADHRSRIDKILQAKGFLEYPAHTRSPYMRPSPDAMSTQRPRRPRCRSVRLWFS